MIKFRETSEIVNIDNIYDINDEAIYASRRIVGCEYELLIGTYVAFEVVKDYEHRICCFSRYTTSSKIKTNLELPSEYINGEVYYTGEFDKIGFGAEIPYYWYKIYWDEENKIIKYEFDEQHDDFEKVCVKINNGTYLSIANGDITNIWLSYKKGLTYEDTYPVKLEEILPNFLIREEKKIIREKIRNNDLSTWENNFDNLVCRINENEIYINDDKYDIVYNVNDLEKIEIFVKDETKKSNIKY